MLWPGASRPGHGWGRGAQRGCQCCLRERSSSSVTSAKRLEPVTRARVASRRLGSG